MQGIVHTVNQQELVNLKLTFLVYFKADYIKQYLHSFHVLFVIAISVT